MTAAQIDLIGEHLPGASISIYKYAGAPIEEQYKAISAFVNRYTNLTFGWWAAGEFARHKLPFPIVMLGRDRWVYRAYLHRLDARKNYDPIIAEAYALSTRDLEGVGRIVKSLLIVEGTTPEDVTKHTGIHRDVVEAFSVLFYDIEGRRNDKAFIAQAVYPDTRFVSLRTGYFENANITDLLVRSGYESGSRDMVSFMAGLTNGDFLRSIAAKGEGAAQLEGAIMANATTIASIGLINQNVVGLQQSRALIVADKQGGNVTQEAPALNIASFLQDSLMQADITHNENRHKVLRANAAIVDV